VRKIVEAGYGFAQPRARRRPPQRGEVAGASKNGCQLNQADLQATSLKDSRDLEQHLVRGSEILNGDVFHLEATLQQFLPLNKQTLISVGANAFYFQQVTGDSGSGAVLGNFEGTDIGIGPVVTLIHTRKSYTFSAQVKWLPELDTSHRLNGDWVWVSLGLQF
jgi:hypothetical protein